MSGKDLRESGKEKKTTFNKKWIAVTVAAIVLAAAAILFFQPEKIGNERLAGNSPFLGEAGAPVVVVEFSDFLCGHCRDFHENTFPLIRKEFIDSGKVKHVFRSFPLQTTKGFEAAKCAEEQGKFFEMFSILFERAPLIHPDFIKDYALELGLNEEKFSSCIDSGKYAQAALKDREEGEAFGVQGTPTFFVNGTRVVGARDFPYFKNLIDSELAKA